MKKMDTLELTKVLGQFDQVSQKLGGWISRATL